jgi:uncharacterized protein (DUF362 family)/NAD-dependent dihydropyrimidine dehydrogenase PreA subunit
MAGMSGVRFQSGAFRERWKGVRLDFSSPFQDPVRSRKRQGATCWMKRRGFIGNIAGLLAVFMSACFFGKRHFVAAAEENSRKLSAAGQSEPVGAAEQGAPRHAVAAVPCASYEEERVYKAVVEALGAIGFEVPAGKRVLLKPNIMAQNTPEQAASTHPAVVAALCRIFRERGCGVTIGDSSAYYQGGCTRRGFATTGMEEIAARWGATLLPFEATRLRRITGLPTVDPLYLTEAVFEHDLVVNVPKLKLHRLARLSGAVKNMFGCVVGGTKQRYHQMLQDRPDYVWYWGKTLVDVYETVRPGLTVMDAVVGLDRDGPAANGTPRPTGVILASKSAPAVDVCACRIMGHDPMGVPALREAIERGLVAPSAIELHGGLPDVPYVKLPEFKLPRGIARSFDHYFFARFIVSPGIKKSRCNRCGVCIENCAAGAMRLDPAKGVRIDYRACINCYCCEEYCPLGAVYLHGGAVNNTMRGIRRVIRL